MSFSGARLLLRRAPARRKRCSGTEDTLTHLMGPLSAIWAPAAAWQHSRPRYLPLMPCLRALRPIPVDNALGAGGLRLAHAGHGLPRRAPSPFAGGPDPSRC